MKRYDLIVVGAGPAGLSAAIEAAKYGLKTVVFDENARPGGPLFKQVHKFFGSMEHKATIRGFKIGAPLLADAEKAGVEVHLNATVSGLFDCKEITVIENETMHHYKADAIILATGARENMIPFEGWTKPGVIGAGAAQTMMNLHGVQPGSRVLMVGSGNVGLVVSFQLLQAGIEVAAIVDAAPRVGGYGVHAAKVARCGVPFYLSHTVIKAEGDDRVTGAVVAEVDSHFKPIPGTEMHLDVDTICMAVGLSPMSQLLSMAGCKMQDKGGIVPIVNEYREASIKGIFAAGDVGGIEEASSGLDAYVKNDNDAGEATSITAPSVCRGIMKYFPDLADAKIVRHWSGFMDDCADHVPIIDKVNEVPGLVIACGFTGHGFGIGPGTGLLLSQLVLGETPCADVPGLRYDRFKAKA